MEKINRMKNDYQIRIYMVTCADRINHKLAHLWQRLHLAWIWEKHSKVQSKRLLAECQGTPTSLSYSPFRPYFGSYIVGKFIIPSGCCVLNFASRHSLACVCGYQRERGRESEHVSYTTNASSDCVFFAFFLLSLFLNPQFYYIYKTDTRTHTRHIQRICRWMHQWECKHKLLVNAVSDKSGQSTLIHRAVTRALK